MPTLPNSTGHTLQPGACLPIGGTRGHLLVILVLFFASGCTGLVYEVLWMRELGLLFGNTALAATTTFAAFFLGLAAGGYVWGRRVAQAQRPLRLYAYLEGGVAVSAVLHFLLLDAYQAIYAPLFQFFGASPGVFVMVKFILAVGVLFPPAFCMGGTLPAMSQYLVQRPDTLGRMAPMLYAVNTFGAALGAYVAGFHLPLLLGFTRSYLVTMALTGAVALIAWLYDRKPIQPWATPVKTLPVSQPSPFDTAPLSAAGIRWLAFLSGCATLYLEVLWVRMFAQVLQNSVYTFSTILVTFLVALALGAVLASVLARRHLSPQPVLWSLLVTSACLVGVSPFVLSWMTDGLTYVGGRQDWGGYILQVFGVAGVVMGLPGLFLGSVFPFLLKMSEAFAHSTGRTVGDLVAINTVGAIVGSLGAGFLCLEILGLWSSMRLVAVGYFLVALLLPIRVVPRWLHMVPVGGLLLLVSGLDTSSLPLVKVDPLTKDESLFEVWEGSAATVAVVKNKTSLKIKVNNYYTLGGTGSQKWEERQAHGPLMIHPQPRSVFLLGMGTGITAGAALQHAVERVVVCELLPEVVTAVRKYFKPYVRGLFDDARATVVVEDGRHYLRGTSERFDVIIADLFLPWEAGTGSLYTREHFTAVRARLQENGLFAQWLPLYQMSQNEFGSVARTMIEVFPLVTLWRGDFFVRRPIVLLVGHRDPTPFVPHELWRTDDVPFMAHYAGNLTAARTLLDRYGLNTDDRPLIEYRAPITHRRQKAKADSWFVGTALMDFMEAVLRLAPPEHDPYLKDLTVREFTFVRSGLSLHQAEVHKKTGDLSEAQDALQEYQRAVAEY
jgi:spermidine synthase